MALMLGPRAKRTAYIALVALVALDSIQWFSGSVSAWLSYSIVGVSLQTVAGVLVLYGTWLLYNRELG